MLKEAFPDTCNRLVRVKNTPIISYSYGPNERQILVLTQTTPGLNVNHRRGGPGHYPCSRDSQISEYKIVGVNVKEIPRASVIDARTLPSAHKGLLTK